MLASISGYGMFVCPFLLTVELLPAEKKTFISMMTNFPFVIGMSVMCLIAWVCKDYQLMHLLGYLPLILLFPLWTSSSASSMVTGRSRPSVSGRMMAVDPPRRVAMPNIKNGT